MKKSRKISIIIFSILITLVFITGCIDPIFNPENIITENTDVQLPEDTGFVQLNFDDPARTILPNTSLDSFAAFELVFTGIEGSSQLGTLPSIDLTLAEVKSGNLIPITAGRFSLAVRAFMDDNKAQPAASAVIPNVLITSGSTTNIDIKLEPISINAQIEGRFSWNITFSNLADLTTAVMNITPVFQGSGTAGTSPVNLLSSQSGSLNLLAGYYYVDISLERPGRMVLGWRQVLHVYQYQESNFSHTFNPANFTISPVNVVFNFNDGSGQTRNRRTLPGGTVIPPNDLPDRTGVNLTFGGFWTLNGGSSTNDSDWGTEFNAQTIANDDIIVYARWIPMPGGQGGLNIELLPFIDGAPELQHTINIIWGETAPVNISNAGDFELIQWYLDDDFNNSRNYDPSMPLVDTTEEPFDLYPSEVVNFIMTYRISIIGFMTTSNTPYSTSVIVNIISPDAAAGQAQFSVGSEEEFNRIMYAIRHVPGNYTVNLTTDLTNYHGMAIGEPDVYITINGNGKNISWRHIETNRFPLFYVFGEGNLVLENINLSRGTGNTLDWPLIVLRGGNLEMKAGTTINGGGYAAVGLERNGSFIMSGGTIEGSDIGIGVWGEDNNIANCASVTITGGTIKGNSDHGILFAEQSMNSTLTVSGANITDNGSGINIEGTRHEITISGNTEISENNNNGIRIDGTKHEVTMTGGTIDSNEGKGIEFAQNSENITLNITGGSIENNNSHGIVISGQNHTLSFSSGSIQGNKNSGIDIWESSELTINISGNAQISGNARGMLIKGPGHEINISGSAQIINNTNQENNQGRGIIFTEESSNSTFNMSGGTISGQLNGAGLSIEGTNNNVILSGTAQIINNQQGITISSSAINSSFNMTGGSISNISNGNGLSVNGEGHNITISGGTIIGNDDNGVSINGTEHDITISGGTIGSNTNHGVYLGGSDYVVHITGNALIDNNDSCGVGIGGSNITLNMDGGTISNNHHGIHSWAVARNTIEVTGGIIISNDGRGVSTGGGNDPSQNHIIKIGGDVVITKNGEGLGFDGAGHEISITGGSISGSEVWGVYLSARESTLTKTGGVIYGNNAPEPDRNFNGAVNIRLNDSDIATWFFIADENMNLGVTISEDGTSIMPGSLVGDGWQ